MEVFLIGGGIGGLTAALCLHEIGIKGRIFETNREHAVAGDAISLYARAVAQPAMPELAELLERGDAATTEKALFSSRGEMILPGRKG